MRGGMTVVGGLFTITMKTSGHLPWVGLRRQPGPTTLQGSLLIPVRWDCFTLGIREREDSPVLLSPGFRGCPHRQLHVVLGRPPSLSPLSISASQVWDVSRLHGEQWEGKWSARQAQLEGQEDCGDGPSAAWTQRASRSWRCL